MDLCQGNLLLANLTQFFVKHPFACGCVHLEAKPRTLFGVYLKRLIRLTTFGHYLECFSAKPLSSWAAGRAALQRILMRNEFRAEEQIAYAASSVKTFRGFVDDPAVLGMQNEYCSLSASCGACSL